MPNITAYEGETLRFTIDIYTYGTSGTWNYGVSSTDITTEGIQDYIAHEFQKSWPYSGGIDYRVPVSVTIKSDEILEGDEKFTLNFKWVVQDDPHGRIDLSRKYDVTIVDTTKKFVYADFNGNSVAESIEVTAYNLLNWQGKWEAELSQNMDQIEALETFIDDLEAAIRQRQDDVIQEIVGMVDGPGRALRALAHKFLDEKYPNFRDGLVDGIMLASNAPALDAPADVRAVAAMNLAKDAWFMLKEVAQAARLPVDIFVGGASAFYLSLPVPEMRKQLKGFKEQRDAIFDESSELASAISQIRKLKDQSDLQNFSASSNATNEIGYMGATKAVRLRESEYATTSQEEIISGIETDQSVEIVGQSGDYLVDLKEGEDTLRLNVDLKSSAVIKSDESIIVGRDGYGVTAFGVEQVFFTDYGLDLTIAARLSDMDPATLDALVALYVAFFNRVPEAAGLSYWAEEFNKGQTVDQIAARFYEAGVAFPGSGYTAEMSDGEFVEMIYGNVLLRKNATAPSTDEIEYWAAKLVASELDRPQMVIRMLADALLFADDPTFGFVADVLDNRVEFGKLHAITYGLNYLSPEEAFARTSLLVSQIDQEGYDNAVTTVGLQQLGFWE